MVPDSVKCVISDFLDDAIIVERLPGVSTFSVIANSALQYANDDNKKKNKTFLFITFFFSMPSSSH